MNPHDALAQHLAGQPQERAAEAALQTLCLTPHEFALPGSGTAT